MKDCGHYSVTSKTDACSLEPTYVNGCPDLVDGRAVGTAETSDRIRSDQQHHMLSN
ncbi:hypothetical protein DPMN_025076 [Dreissena polymorpha]|uniref:Uncharacterized protein n=1 Tax=Dreissena polymorpha TaxID=45954 RepID=A0A9D4LQX6_DREPO|nr:hypothetical protein DPMN_025076 [Dreissena polymorpha]